jgi:hypothetical protein
MGDSVWVEVAKQVPFAVVLFAAILVFLDHLKKVDAARMLHDKEMETLRITAAKERETERRAYDASMNNMWAVNIKNIVDRQEQTAKMIADALSEHERASKDRYEKMNITKDLLDVAKEKLKGK